MPEIAGTLQTDPRSGGVKRSSGVNVLPIVAETWAEVRDDGNADVDWLLIGYEGSSKTDMTLLEKGSGGIEAVCAKLPDDTPVFGGIRLTNGKFVSFVYMGDSVPAMKRGRTLMYKNGVFNVLEGCVGEIEMQPGLTEATMGQIR